MFKRDARELCRLSAKMLLVLGFGATPLMAFAQNEAAGEYYPEAAVKQSYAEELAERKKADELERRANMARDLQEKKKVEAEREIAARRLKIQNYTVKQDEYQRQINGLEAVISQLEEQKKRSIAELQDTEEKLKQQSADFAVTKADLENKRQEILRSIEEYRSTKQKTQESLYHFEVDSQKLRAEIAKGEADLARFQNDTARAQAEEVQARSDWAQLQARVSEINNRKAQALNDLNDLHQRLDNARSDLKSTRDEALLADRERNQLEERLRSEKTVVLAELKTTELAIAQANNDHQKAEADRVRMEAEVEKLRSDLVKARMKATDMMQVASAANGSAMQARIDLEKAKVELIQELSSTEATALRSNTHEVHRAYLAENEVPQPVQRRHTVKSMPPREPVKLPEPASGLVQKAENDSASNIDGKVDIAPNGGEMPKEFPKREVASAEPRSWTATKACFVHAEPSAKAKNLAVFPAGKSVMASPDAGTYLKFKDDDGSTHYVNGKCGKYNE